MRHALLVLLAAVAAIVHTGKALAETEVDVALVLAVDVSRSMDADEQQLQREGYAEAFRSQIVHDAIARGALGRIAVTYVEWSGVSQQNVVVPWTVLDGSDTARVFAEQLATRPIGLIFSTSISGAIDFSTRLLEESGLDALRRVIDISGDGPNNTGRMVTLARDDAIMRGIVINGLPLMLKRPSGRGEIENLDLYYRDCVIGGAGSFLVPVRERHQIADAIRTKIVREIAGLGDPEPLIKRAQAPVRMNCLSGEQQRQQQWGP